MGQAVQRIAVAGSGCGAGWPQHRHLGDRQPVPRARGSSRLRQRSRRFDLHQGARRPALGARAALVARLSGHAAAEMGARLRARHGGSLVDRRDPSGERAHGGDLPGAVQCQHLDDVRDGGAAHPALSRAGCAHARCDAGDSSKALSVIPSAARDLSGSDPSQKRGGYPALLGMTATGGHSMSMLSCFSFLPQKPCSSLTNWVNSARERSGGCSRPSRASASCHFGFFIASLVDFSILSRTSAGVLAGANRPCQLVTTTSMPCSFSVGTSGSDETRLSPVTASALRLPPLIWETAGGSDEKFMVIWPLITSATAGAVPL